MRILIICQYFHPDITAAAFRMSDAAELLTKGGHEVRVITAEPHRVQVQSPTGGHPPLPESTIWRSPLHPVSGSGFVPYVKHYLSFVRGSIASAWRLKHTGWKPDVIWASSPPLFTAITGYVSSKLFRRPWVLDVRDIWPDSAVAAGQLRDGSRAFRIGKRMERFFYDHANHITCVSVPMQTYISGLTRTPVNVVYNGIQSAAIAAQTGAVRSGRTSKILLYAGNLGRVQALDMLVNAVAELEKAQRMDGWEVRLLGAGAVREQLAASVKALNLDARVKILPPVSRAEVTREMSAADALFLSLKPDPVLRVTIPSKLFDYLGAGLPILAGIVGEGAEIARRSGGNIVYLPDDPASLRSALLDLMHNFDQLAVRAIDNTRVVREAYTRERAISVLQNVLSKVAKE